MSGYDAGRLYEETCAPLRGYFGTRLPWHEDVEDLVQDTWVRLLRRRYEQAHKGLVFTVARSVLIDHVRATKPQDAVPESVAGHERGYDAVLDRLMLEAPLAGLTDEQQTVLDLVYRQGMESPEVGTRLGITKSGVQKCKQRALRTLRRSLETGVIVDRRRMAS